MDNPWKGRGDNAPFDQMFFLVMDVAVGGSNGYFPDGLGDNKPWLNTDPQAVKTFHNRTSEWVETWEDPAMQVRSVKLWQHSDWGSFAVSQQGQQGGMPQFASYGRTAHR